MARYRVGVTPRALADIEKISKWWRANRPSAPRMFQNELDRALVNIASHPESGRSVELRAYPGARTYVLRKSGYVVVYNVDDDAGHAEIKRAHAARYGAGSVAPERLRPFHNSK